jgi:PII-like signaling protein
MSAEALKLTAYFGERARAGDRSLADALLARCGEAGVATSVLVRGLSGFGAKHGVSTDRLLTLSEDLPLVAAAVDEPARIEALAEAVAPMMDGGLLTLERARLVGGAGAGPDTVADARAGPTKVTVYVGRRQRVAGQPAARAVVDVLRRHGMAGASVLLGVDGTAHGERHRASFVGRNVDVPLMVLAVGGAGPAAAAVAELAALLTRPLITLERVTVLKRDGQHVASPPDAGAGPGERVKLMVYASQAAHVDGLPLHTALIAELRRAGAPGATVLRGVWGYHGDHAPHGDRLLALRRRVPAVAVVVVEAEHAPASWAVLDTLTQHTGLVTWERVPRVLGGRGSAPTAPPRARLG